MSKSESMATLMVAALVLVGCATPSPLISKIAKPHPGMGHVYGIFSRTGGYSYILHIENLTGKQNYNIKLRGPEVQVVEVVPGQYRISRIYLTDMMNAIEKVRNMDDLKCPSNFKEPFRVADGEAVYLGNYRGETYGCPATGYGWSDLAVGGTFEETTTTFRQQYSGFQTIRCRSVFDWDAGK